MEHQICIKPILNIEFPFAPSLNREKPFCTVMITFRLKSKHNVLTKCKKILNASMLPVLFFHLFLTESHFAPLCSILWCMCLLWFDPWPDKSGASTLPLGIIGLSLYATIWGKNLLEFIFIFPLCAKKWQLYFIWEGEGMGVDYKFFDGLMVMSYWSVCVSLSPPPPKEHIKTEGELERMTELLKELKDSVHWCDACCRVILYCVQHNYIK